MINFDTIKKFSFILVLSCMSYFTQSQEPMTKSSESIAEWNKKLFEIAIEEDGLLTLKGVRTAAMVHTAMHDAA